MSEHVISCRDIGFHVGCSENTTLDMKLILATWNCKIPTWKWLHDKIYFMSGMCKFHVAEKKFHVAEKVDFPDGSSGFIPTNKQTHKQTKFKHTSILLTTIPATKQPRHLKCGTRSSECDEIPAYKHTSSLPSMQHTSIQQSSTAPIPSLSPSPHHCTIQQPKQR